MSRCAIFGLAWLWLAVTAMGQVQTPVPSEIPSTHYLSNYVRAEVNGEVARQGALVFDGNTTSQRAVVNMREHAIGTGDFSLWMRMEVPQELPSAGAYLAIITPESTGGTAGRIIQVHLASIDVLSVRLRGVTSLDYRAIDIPDFHAEYGGRVVDLLITRAAATDEMTIYVNGEEKSGEESTLGAPPAWGEEILGPYLHVGNISNLPWRGRVAGCALFNYALSRDEARELTLYGVAPKIGQGRFREKIKYPSRNGEMTATATDWAGSGGGSVLLDATNDELDVTAASVSQGIVLDDAHIEAVRPGVLHRLEFEIRNSTITDGQGWVNFGPSEVGIGTWGIDGIYWTEFTPDDSTAELYFISNEAGTFSVANVRLVEVGNVDGGKRTPEYESDFSAGEDGWVALNGTVTGNIDSIAGENDTLRYYADATSGNHGPVKGGDVAVFGKRYRLSFDYYLPSANTTLKRAQPRYGNGFSISGAPWAAVQDEWTSYSHDFTHNSSFLYYRIYTGDTGSSIIFTGANSVTDDLLYIKNWKVQEIAATGSLVNGGFDETGTGEDTFLGWEEGISGSTTISQETVAGEFYSQGAHISGTGGSAKMVVDGANSPGTLTAEDVMLIGRKYRVRLRTRVDSVSGSPTILVGDGTTTHLTISPTTEWVESTVDFVATARDLVLSSGAAAGRTIWIDTVSVHGLGAVVNLDCGVGVGYQVPDRSMNGLSAMLTDVVHAKPVRSGQVRGRTSTNGSQQLLGTTCMPPNGRIDAIVITSDAAATVDIGTRSGTADIANNVPVVAGRNEVSTFAGRYSNTGSIWVISDSTAELDFTITYDLVD